MLVWTHEIDAPNWECEGRNERGSIVVAVMKAHWLPETKFRPYFTDIMTVDYPLVFETVEEAKEFADKNYTLTQEEFDKLGNTLLLLNT